MSQLPTQQINFTLHACVLPELPSRVSLRTDSNHLATFTMSQGGFLPGYHRHQIYAAERMYGTAEVFSAKSGVLFLRGLKPKVLRAAPPRVLSIDLGNFSGPPELGEPAKQRSIKLYNPSIVAAPFDLCPRCSFVASARADALHQCDRTSPLFHSTRRIATGAFYKGSAILVLDSKLQVIAWTWFISQPQKQVSTWSTHSRTHVPAGVSGGYAPPWAQQVYDVRLLNLDGRQLFATYNCVACKFSVSQVHLTRMVTADGGLTNLRSWASQRRVFHEGWLQGRNQALFSVSKEVSIPKPWRPTPAPGITHTIHVQPWMGIIGTVGTPSFKAASKICYGADYYELTVAKKHQRRIFCGPTPPNTTLSLEVLHPSSWSTYGKARVLRVGNSSRFHCFLGSLQCHPYVLSVGPTSKSYCILQTKNV